MAVVETTLEWPDGVLPAVPEPEVGRDYQVRVESSHQSRLQRVAHAAFGLVAQFQHEVPSEHFRPVPDEYLDTPPYSSRWLGMP